MSLRQRFALLRAALGLRQSEFRVQVPEPVDPEVEAFVREVEAWRLSPAGQRAEDLRQIEAAALRAAR